MDMIIALAVITATFGIGFAAVNILGLRRLRATVVKVLAEVASQQVRSAQRFSDQIARLQRQQEAYNQQIQILAQAGLRLRQDLTSVSTRLEHAPSETAQSGQTIH